MIYAYDLAVLMPIRDLYDSLMMATAIGAAKDMYEKGLAEVKDFRNKYDDFVAASPQDQAWFNREFNIGGFINDLYNKGIDPFRTQEGRAAVQNYINTRDIKNYANVKKTAEIAQEFNKNKALLQRQGLYNPEIASMEGPGPEDWDTIGNKAPFDRMSPTPYHDMATFSAPYFEGLKPIQKTTKKNGITYNTYSITEQDLHNIADRHFNDLVITPQGQLMYKMFKQQAGGDPTVARKMFNEAVVSGNLRKLQYTDDYTQRVAEREKNALEREKLLLSKEIAQIRANNSRKGGKVRIGENGQVEIDDEDTMTPWITKAIMSHQIQYGRNIIGDPRQGLNKFKQTIQGIYDNYSKAMVEESKRAGVEGEKIVDEPSKQTVKLIPTDLAKPGVFHYSEYSPEKYHVKYKPANTKAYKELRNSRNKMWFILNDIKVIENGEPEKSKFSTKEAYDNAMKAYQNAATNLSKYIDPSGMPTAELNAELAKIDLQRILNISTDKQLIDYANDWYSRRQNRSNYDPNSVSYKNYLGILGASKDEEHIPELGRDARTVSFDGVVYSPAHRVNVSGAGYKMSDNSLVNIFSNWLKNSGQNGWLLNNKISTAEIEKQGQNNPQIEVEAWATVSPTLIEQFYASLPKHITKKYSKKDVVSALGLRPRSVQSKLDDDYEVGKEFKPNTYYDVPVTGIHDTNEILQSIELNLMESKEYFGTSKTLNEDLENAALDLLMY